MYIARMYQGSHYSGLAYFSKRLGFLECGAIRAFGDHLVFQQE